MNQPSPANASSARTPTATIAGNNAPPPEAAAASVPTTAEFDGPTAALAAPVVGAPALPAPDPVPEPLPEPECPAEELGAGEL